MADDKEINLNKKIRKSSILLVWACFLLYVFSMGSKNIYTAEVVAIQGVFNKTKAEVSLAMTFFFITYAIMQVILALIMKKINLKIYMTVTATLSAIVTVLIAFMPSIEALYVICAINGVVQAGIYSGCMAVLSKYLPKEMLPYGNKIMSLGIAFYGVIAYGTPAIFVSLGSWNLSFIVIGILFFGPIIFFFCAVSNMKKYSEFIERKEEIIVSEQNEQTIFEINGKTDVICFYVLMMWITLVGNCAHYMVMNWIPNLLHGVFSMPQGYSILITLLAPVAQAIGPMIVIGRCEKSKNITAISISWAIVGLITNVILIFAYSTNIVLVIVLLLLFILLGQGSRTVFGGVLAFKLRDKINSGAYIATTNAVASLAAGIMPPIAGLIIDSCSGFSGYGKLFFVVSVIYLAFILTLSLLLYFTKIKKKTNNLFNSKQ